jgi:release factor glutamine methyltransferase
VSPSAGPDDGRSWTVLDVLKWTAGHFERAGLENARLDAELLLAHVLGCDRVRLYMDYERPLDPDERAAYRALVRRRAAGEPAAYLLGEKEFYGRPFKVDPRVLIPRPETEHLVDAALEALGPGAAGTVLDLCTGSGCIASTLAAERPDLSVVAVDLSADACALARENAERLGVSERVRILEGDLFAPVRAAGLGPFDAIVSNPPYVASLEMAGLMRDVRDHEPHLALEAGPDGTELLIRILEEAPDHAVPGAPLILEHAEGQGARLSALARADGRYTEVRDVRDHSGLDRMLVARVKG